MTAAAKALADAAAGALRGALDIHSPSRVTFQAGVFFDEGLLSGIMSSANRVEREAQLLGLSAAQALRQPAVSQPVSPVSPAPAAAAAAPLGDMSITIPLEIDGYRLGVAAIESINRVAGGTGRVALDL